MHRNLYPLAVLAPGGGEHSELITSFVDAAVAEPGIMQSVLPVMGFDDDGQLEVWAERRRELNATAQQCAKLIVRVVEAAAVDHLMFGPDVWQRVGADPTYQQLALYKHELEPGDATRQVVGQMLHLATLAAFVGCVAEAAAGLTKQDVGLAA